MAKGVITLRLRIELASEHALLMSNLQVPPAVHIHVKKWKGFKVSTKTIEGNVNLMDSDTDVLSTYLEELISYLIVYYYTEDAKW